MNRKSSGEPTNYSFIILIAVIVVVGGIILLQGSKDNPGMTEQGSTSATSSTVAPDFSLPKIGGGMGSIKDYHGKVVVLDFWATWCGPCKAEIPDFIALQKMYGDKGLQIVGIALDEQAKVESFVREYGINYPILIGTDAVSQTYGGIEGIPTTFIIDREGKIITSFVGFREKRIFEEEIVKLL